MLKLVFQNATAKDTGYGLEVNGKSLEEIISTALGTRVGNKAGYGSNLPSFESNCCNISISIDPQPVTERIEDNENRWDSVKEMEEEICGQFSEKDGEGES